jgi:hypothetical protein
MNGSNLWFASFYGQVEREQEPRKSAQEETEPQELDDPTS